VYIEKNQLDSFATELCREAEISGRVGTETDARARELEEQTGLHPSVDWSRTGKIPLDQEFTVTVSAQANIGLFGGFGSFPINLEGKANGKSEIYWK
jgi:8-oxo-dGTP pyrophosphatase MutT (NUDIX family)